MAGHSRRHSRGSIFSFTIDAVRSLSRVGSRQAIRVDDEDHSLAPILPTSDEPEARNPGGVPTPLPAGRLTPSNSNIPSDVKKTRMPRPLSWLPTPRSRKNKVGRSISAPVLTSTTNATVARVEGVRCGELTQADLIQSTWNPQVGWVPDSSSSAEHIGKAATTTEVADENEGSMINDTDRLKKYTKKPRNATLLRLKGAIRIHLDSLAMTRRPTISDKSQFTKLEEGNVSPTTRRRAEGVSLCKQKIRYLTGHGNVKRKPIKDGHPFSRKNIGERHHEEQPLLMSASMSSPNQLNDFREHPDLSRAFTFGDLEKSFMNAVDKLNFQQTPEQTLESMGNSYRKYLLSGLYEEEPNVTDTRKTTTVNMASIHASRSEPYSFSASQAGLVPTPNSERRPEVNPLRCHPNVTEFTERLVDTSDVSTPPMSTSTPRIEITEEVVEDLENAPIYSPSSGDLSQYARLTPSPARSAASSFRRTPLLAASNVDEIPYYTPTRPSGRSTTADYAVIQRGRETTVCDSNPQLFSGYEEARVKENKGIEKQVDGAKKSKTTRARKASGNAMSIDSPKAPRNPQASDLHRQQPGHGAEERKEILKLSPYRVGNSKRIIGWAPLPSSPVYRSAPPGRTTCGHVSDEDLASTK